MNIIVQNLRCSARFLFEHIILTHFSIQIVYKLFLTSCIIKLDYLRKAELTLLEFIAAGQETQGAVWNNLYRTMTIQQEILSLRITCK